VFEILYDPDWDPLFRTQILSKSSESPVRQKREGWQEKEKLSIASIPPSLPKELIHKEGTEVKITRATISTDVDTPLGHLGKALTIECRIKGDESQTYSYIWGLDKATIAGSAGRILAKTGAKTLAELNASNLGKLVGASFTVRNRVDKLYWY
jgi:hypothetical protein